LTRLRIANELLGSTNHQQISQTIIDCGIIHSF
jgi:hypothetical protein